MEVQFEVVFCATCHVSFAITHDLNNRLRDCHNTFYCPMGHTNFFPAKTEREILQEANEKLVHERNQAELELARIHKQKAKQKRARSKDKK